MREPFLERLLARLLELLDRLIAGPVGTMADAASSVEMGLAALIAVVGPTVLSLLLGIAVWWRRGPLLATIAAGSAQFAVMLAPGRALSLTVAQVLLAACVGSVLATASERMLEKFRGSPAGRSPAGVPDARWLVASALVLMLVGLIGAARAPWWPLASLAVAVAASTRGVPHASPRYRTVVDHVAFVTARTAQVLPPATAIVLVLGAVGGGGLGWHLAGVVVAGNRVGIVSGSLAAALLIVIVTLLVPVPERDSRRSADRWQRTLDAQGADS